MYKNESLNVVVDNIDHDGDDVILYVLHCLNLIGLLLLTWNSYINYIIHSYLFAGQHQHNVPTCQSMLPSAELLFSV